MEKSAKKRAVIILAYLLFFGLVFWALYSLFKPKASCTDGIKNQNEQGVDCGGVCPGKCPIDQAKDLVVGGSGTVDSSVSGQYDFYAVVTNPNNAYGAKSFRYHAKFEDASGAIIAERDGTSFILPGEKKYVIENNIPMSESPSRIDFSITDPEWIEVDDFYEKPDLEIVNKSYDEITSGVGFAEAKGLLENKSPFDFALIKIEVIVRDAGGKVIALNSTEMRTVNSGENRDYRVFWPSRFSGEMASVENQVEVNIFNSDAFAKKYFRYTGQ